MHRLDVARCALSVGVAWSSCIFLMGLMARRGTGVELVRLLSRIYRGFGPSFRGLLLGSLWALADGALTGALFALFVNLF
ncbi:MAG: membrane-associated protein [Candidatus Omnitrophica bacterium]|nr:membrane-associated protein [Candidatus Omnitrophota bacterium]